MKTVLRVLLALLSLLLAFLLSAAVLVSAALYTVRGTYTPAFVSDTVRNLDYASVRFPDGFGGFTTVLDELNAELGYYGLEFTPENFNDFVRTLSFDRVFEKFALEFRSWLLSYGPRPRLDPDETAATITSGLDSQVLSFLSFFMEPEDMIADSIALLAGTDALNARLDTLEHYRPYLSADALLFCLSAAAVCALLLLVSRKLRLLPSLTIAGLSVTAAGAVMTFAETLLRPQKNALLADLALPESTFDLLYKPLMIRAASNGRLLLMGGLALAAVAGLLWILTSSVRRARENAARAGEAALPRFPVPEGPAEEHAEEGAAESASPEGVPEGTSGDGGNSEQPVQ